MWRLALPRRLVCVCFGGDEGDEELYTVAKLRETHATCRFCGIVKGLARIDGNLVLLLFELPTKGNVRSGGNERLRANVGASGLATWEVSLAHIYLMHCKVVLSMKFFRSSPTIPS